MDPIVEEKEEREKGGQIFSLLVSLLETHFCPGFVQRRISLPATTLSLSSS